MRKQIDLFSEKTMNAPPKKFVRSDEFAPPAVSRRPRSTVRRVSLDDAVRSFGILLAAREGLRNTVTGDGLVSATDEGWALDTLQAFIVEAVTKPV